MSIGAYALSGAALTNLPLAAELGLVRQADSANEAFETETVMAARNSAR